MTDGISERERERECVRTRRLRERDREEDWMKRWTECFSHVCCVFVCVLGLTDGCSFFVSAEGLMEILRSALLYTRTEELH